MKLVKFYGVLHDLRGKPDGSFRIQLDVGSDNLEELIEMLRYFHKNLVNVAVALSPYREVDPKVLSDEIDRQIDYDP